MGTLRERLESRDGPLVFGVLNCTPDSFSDGGQFVDPARALDHALRLVEEGADVIDIGAESTRPGAPRIDAREQRARLGGLVGMLSRRGVLVSIDTTDPEVASFALDEGASLVNSVELGPARALARVVRKADAMLALMHSRGGMTEMPGFSAMDEAAYGDVVLDVRREWRAARDEALDEGLAVGDVWLDPGLGFHKSARHSLALCARLAELALEGAPVLVGPSRKSFLAVVTAAPGEAPRPPSERLGATIAAAIACAQRGASALRVHDVLPVRQALRFARVLDA
jgi:dihydropteroate synthase